jgi:hypothetical protein
MKRRAKESPYCYKIEEHIVYNKRSCECGVKIQTSHGVRKKIFQLASSVCGPIMLRASSKTSGRESFEVI